MKNNNIQINISKLHIYRIQLMINISKKRQEEKGNEN